MAVYPQVPRSGDPAEIAGPAIIGVAAAVATAISVAELGFHWTQAISAVLCLWMGWEVGEAHAAWRQARAGRRPVVAVLAPVEAYALTAAARRAIALDGGALTVEQLATLALAIDIVETAGDPR